MKIIVITQQHKLPFGIEPTQQIIDATIRLQLKVADELKKQPDYPIVIEGLCEDATEDDALSIADVVKWMFPAGIPTDFNELSGSQKDFLYKYGATRTLFYLGEILLLFKSIHKDVSDALDKRISQGDYQDIFALREIEAINCAKEAATKYCGKTEGATVILVFGGGHDFESRCRDEGIEYELIDTVIPISDEVSEETIAYELSGQKEPIQKELITFLDAMSAKSTKKKEEQSFESQLNALNSRLQLVPKDIPSRLKRAKIFLKQKNYSQALDDYSYVLGEYPTNIKAKKGVEFCKKHLLLEDIDSDLPPTPEPK
jgi:hypothetical protein